ncbi:uncharacterized protein LOC117339910 [Pecten maximus]|uniref:uncharacterized protein LOC117339910 n=1 Tax=Pecten maximus TaxID=6579 RepID=UPI001458ADE6|nr:uncharacterized protein LOC117339910 [Pecten maximus]
MADFRRMFDVFQQYMSGFLSDGNNPAPNATSSNDVLGDSLDAFVSQNEVHSPVEDMQDADLVMELNEYFANEDKCGPNISDGLASAVSNGFRIKIPKEKRKALLDLNKWPGNCNSLKTPRVNKAVWQSMTRSARDTDVGMQILQSTACSVTYPLLGLIDQLNICRKENRPIFGGEITSCIKWLCIHSNWYIFDSQTSGGYSATFTPILQRTMQ